MHATDQEWLASLPIGDMIKFGWVSPAPRPAEEVAECLRFFGVASVPMWLLKYGNIGEMAAFRTSPSFESRPASVATWMRRGEIESQEITCSPWNRKRFEESLTTIRELTRQKDPGRFVPKLVSICATSGVAVAVVRAPNGCRASGAVRFLAKDKALLLLSFRHLSDDHFWFTFFHEAAHLVLHGDNAFFIEGLGSPTTKQEQEANQFAGRTLIPEQFQAAFIALKADSRAVIRFARRLGLSPGVVVGQLQHHGRLAHDQLNGLKRRFTWGE